MALPKNGDFSELLGNGENPNGMIAQTPNGTERGGVGSDGRTWRWDMADGPRWNADPMPIPPSLVPIEAMGETGPTIARGRVAVNGYTRRKPK
jgi:hypothetical protein